MGWVAHFDNSDWYADFGSWSGSDWDSEYLGINILQLSELGSWVNSYRPLKVRITFTGSGGSLDLFWITDEYFTPIAVGSPYTSGTELDISFEGYDIAEILIYGSTAFTVTNIEFYEGPGTYDVDVTDGIKFGDSLTATGGIQEVSVSDGIKFGDSLTATGGKVGYWHGKDGEPSDQANATTANYTYVPDFGPVPSGGYVTKIEVYCTGSGTMDFAAFSKSGNNFTDLMWIEGLSVVAGLNQFYNGIDYDARDLYVDVGEWLGHWASGTVDRDHTVPVGGYYYDLFDQIGDGNSSGFTLQSGARVIQVRWFINAYIASETFNVSGSDGFEFSDYNEPFTNRAELAWGEETPSPSATAIDWTDWKYSDTSSVKTSGGDYGKAQISYGDYMYGPVEPVYEDMTLTFGTSANKYGIGEDMTLYMRGSTSTFTDVAPTADVPWVEYTGSRLRKTWKYVQVKVKWN
jgi:hypothetical protein